MFGYIVVNKAELKFREFDVYHSFYCGICQDIKRKYGVSGQLSLSYDMTFVAMLLSGLYEPETRLDCCKCVAHPFEKHETRTNLYTEYAADMNALFAYYKCVDDWQDERKLRKLIYGKILQGKTEGLKVNYAEKLQKIKNLMQSFSAAEKEEHPDIDKLSDLFGRVMAEIMTPKEDEWSQNLRNLGYQLGKFIYIMDAYEDVEADIRKGNVNPLKAKYANADFEEECKTILMMMMSGCCKEFEILPILEHVDILRNILYSGVWCRYEQLQKIRREREEGARTIGDKNV